MTKKFLFLAILVFLLFASPPLIIAIYNGELKDILIISGIIILVCVMSIYEYNRKKGN
ncbi:hypothetical protein ACU3L3_14145 [Priestia endophytica]|uniref:Uncharacterized protein n=1 Tax=Priestia endophytica DSM 13796 TaxID=1121089 RepID=A0A1I6BUY5_9BACI|nr:hypothetical protein [Priestia endophytica]SFQ84743.1 hypothetical protein SAMN02745910_04269 [Priestia endophytica DSM 13796]